MKRDSRVQELIRKAPNKGVATIGEERKMFLDAAFEEHFGAELAGDLPAINASYSKEGGHLNFNGVRYESEEELTAFHKGFGFSNEGMLSGIGGDITHITYTQESMVVEYALRATIEIDLPDAPKGRSVGVPMCVVYEFDEAGKLTSERVYADSAAVLPKRFLPI
ncbi:MAG: hypothetical protein E2O48_00830 [Gemmatimonadetes bacterium]|nr:MAG: hypothetical protein E2O48_00830 [Gemmatimonadota bacterium]